MVMRSMQIKAEREVTCAWSARACASASAMAAAAFLAAISGGMPVPAERKAVAGSSQGILLGITIFTSTLTAHHQAWPRRAEVGSASWTTYSRLEHHTAHCVLLIDICHSCPLLAMLLDRQVQPRLLLDVVSTISSTSLQSVAVQHESPAV